MSSQTPKYMHLKSKIKDWAFNGDIRPGDQIPTEHQLADQFQISRQTVRMAINELVHENVLYRVQGRGTFLSETFLQEKEPDVSHRIVAVITTYISDYIFPSIIRGIESRLSEANYSMLLLSTNNNFEREAQALDSVLQRPVDGVIIEPTKSTHYNPNIRRLLSLAARQVPMVTFHASYVELGLPCVRMDDEQGGFLAAEHLLDMGHTRIGMVAKMDDVQGRLRLRGFIRAHQTRNVPIRPEWIQFYQTDEQTTKSSEYVGKIVSSPSTDRPTAVVCYNDEVAAQLVESLGGSNISVPQDMSILSFDDSQWAQSNHCTSIKHPKQQMGEQVADYILRAIEARSRSNAELLSDFIFEPTIEVRSSTKDARAHTR